MDDTGRAGAVRPRARRHLRRRPASVDRNVDRRRARPWRRGGVRRAARVRRDRPRAGTAPRDAATRSPTRIVSDAVDAAIDDAIAHLRRSTKRQMERAGDWQIESEPGLTVGEKITPISSVGLFMPSGKASYPSVAYQLAVPGRRRRRARRSRSSCHRARRATVRSIPPSSSCAASWASATCSASTARRASPRSGSARRRSRRSARSSGRVRRP